MGNLSDFEVEQLIADLGKKDYNIEIEQILSPRLVELTGEVTNLIQAGQDCRSIIAGKIIAKELGDDPGTGIDQLESDLKETVERLRKAHKESVSIRQILSKYPIV